MKILIIILNYNGLELLRKHLQSVVNTSYDNFDIAIVDNASADNSVKYIKNKYPNIKVIKSKTNIGFGNANNLAVRMCPDYDAYVFLNNDMEVEKDWLTKLAKVLESDKKIGAVGPKVLYAQKRHGKYYINSAGVNINKHYLSYDRYDGVEDSKQYSITENVDALTGGALLVRSDVFKEIKGFSKKMFFYYEDIDLSLRIKDKGYKLFYCGKSVVYHDHMGTASKKYSSTKRNMMSMKNRYISIVNRKGFLVGLKETIWYLFNWFFWKISVSKKMTLKQYLERNE